FNVNTGFYVNITLMRYSTFYSINIVTPVILLTVLSFMTFCVDSASEGKMNLAITVLLGFMFIQGVVTTLIPQSRVTPYLNIFVLCCLLMSSLNIILAGICFLLANLKSEPPKCVGFFVIRVCAFLLYPSYWKELCSKCRNRNKIVEGKDSQSEVTNKNNAI